MSLRIFALVYMACFATLSIGLYLVKYSVQNIQHDVVTLKAELGNEKESLHLLNAEWAYLNRPDRLHHLAEAHLNLVPLDSRRIENVAMLPAALKVEPDELLERSMLVQPIHQLVEAQ